MMRLGTGAGRPRRAAAATPPAGGRPRSARVGRRNDRRCPARGGPDVTAHARAGGRHTSHRTAYRLARSSSNSSTRTNRRRTPRQQASVRGAVSCTGPETTVPSGRHPPSVTMRCRHGCPFAAQRCHGAGSLGNGEGIERGVDARARRLDPGCRTRPRKRFEGSREVEQFHVIETEDGEVLQAT